MAGFRCSEHAFGKLPAMRCGLYLNGRILNRLPHQPLKRDAPHAILFCPFASGYFILRLSPLPFLACSRSRALSGKTRKRQAQVPSPSKLTPAPPPGDTLNPDGVATVCSKKRTISRESELERLEWQPKAIDAAVRRRFGEKSGLSKQPALDCSR